ncbi:MAG TPA: hypothetical protein VI564_05410 [Candidatus Nanoarchaeia archaeon]|nr:hypothetical protein [Candidatus Nanoarchaeia archaeon]
MAFQTDELPQVMEQMYPLLRKIRKNHRFLTSLIAKLPPAERSDAIRAAQKLSYHRGDGKDYAAIVEAIMTFPAEERSSLLDLGTVQK